ncbi:NAD(P)-binding protein [Pholiota conissans]|uniref:NAD(P)-binding protein n=1 Tax=Pholiota conissans TaxID=109636 RepID=A0A9P5YNA4_9AGAR|nr:NAD(P)-binding protein [Pholiota conissans]
MPTFVESRDANAAFNPSYVPVMVVTGATGGIGQAMLEALARHLKGRIHLILVGRNRAAAEAIIAKLPTCPESKYEFYECDIVLMKNVHTLADDLLKRLPKVNFLVLCAGRDRFWGPRKETEEGIDDMFAIRYYSRFVLTRDLLPLVISVLGAGMAPEVNLDDLGLKKKYSAINAALQATVYNDLMVAVNPEIAFTHIWPGWVFNGMIVNSGILAKSLSFVLGPLQWLIGTTPEKNAEYMLFGLLSAKKGMYRRGRRGEDIGMKRFLQAKDAQRILHEHSVEETARK